MQQLEFTLPFFSRLLIANEHGLGMSELAALAVIGLCNEARVNQIADAAKMTPIAESSLTRRVRERTPMPSAVSEPKANAPMRMLWPAA